MATVGPQKELRNSSRDLILSSPSPYPSLLSSTEFPYERTLLACLPIYCSCYHRFTVLSLHLTAWASCFLRASATSWFLWSLLTKHLSASASVFYTQTLPSPNERMWLGSHSVSRGHTCWTEVSCQTNSSLDR